jgi:hypothetical protein
VIGELPHIRSAAIRHLEFFANIVPKLMLPTSLLAAKHLKLAARAGRVPSTSE